MCSLLCGGGSGEDEDLKPERSFFSYEARDTGFSVECFWERYAQVKTSIVGSRTIDGVEEYRQFVHRLRALKSIHLVPLRELMSPQKERKTFIALRFDVDMEPLTAIRLARYNARYGIPSSFFLLHTAYYYGIVRNRIFYRNPLLKDWVKALIVAGCEIGLHTDALSMYLDEGIDGAMAITEEINWLRMQGAHIHGTAGHNSYPAYNAENFEIFRDRSLRGRRHASRNGKGFPLGVLDETELNLSYEANYPIVSQTQDEKGAEVKIESWRNSTNSESVESEKWMRTYLLDNPCFERAFEAGVWHHGGNRWTIATRVNRFLRPHWYWRVDGEQLFRILEILPCGLRVVFLLHPIYFSVDTNPV